MLFSYFGEDGALNKAMHSSCKVKRWMVTWVLIYMDLILTTLHFQKDIWLPKLVYVFKMTIYLTTYTTIFTGVFVWYLLLLHRERSSFNTNQRRQRLRFENGRSSVAHWCGCFYVKTSHQCFENSFG